MRKIKVVVLLVRQLQHGFTKNAKVSPNLTVTHFFILLLITFCIRYNLIIRLLAHISNAYTCLLVVYRYIHVSAPITFELHIKAHNIGTIVEEEPLRKDSPKYVKTSWHITI